MPGAYVKVYARAAGGGVGFIKDGYTDLRGRFDYVSLNTDEAGQADARAELAKLGLHALVAAIEMVYPVDDRLALGHQPGDHQPR